MNVKVTYQRDIFRKEFVMEKKRFMGNGVSENVGQPDEEFLKWKNKKSAFCDSYTENGKSVMTFYDEFVGLSVVRAVTDNETTLDVFDKLCGTNILGQLDEWDRILGAPEEMLVLKHEEFDDTNKVKIMAAWWAKEHGLHEIYRNLGEVIIRTPDKNESYYDKLLEEYEFPQLGEREKEYAGYACVSYLKTGCFTCGDLIYSRLNGTVYPLCICRTAPGELWILGDGGYNFDLLHDEKNPVLKGNAECEWINLRCSRRIGPEEIDELIYDEEEIVAGKTSNIKGKHMHEFYDYISNEWQLKHIDELFNNMPWKVDFYEDNAFNGHNEVKIKKVKVSYK